MSRRQNAKYKLDRRVGENVWGRPKSPINTRQTRPGQHGARRTNKPSDFGLQLMAKQKLKGFYGDITEKQFRKTYEEAARRTGNTAELLVGLLESRLDTIVYRAKFVPTIFAARQFVNHGHVTLNGKKANIASMTAEARRRRPGARAFAQHGAGDRSHGLGRARRSGICRSRPESRHGEIRPHAGPLRHSVRGPDGAEPGGRVLLVVTGGQDRTREGAAPETGRPFAFGANR